MNLRVDLEAGRAPVDKLNALLHFDRCDCCIHVLSQGEEYFAKKLKSHFGLIGLILLLAVPLYNVKSVQDRKVVRAWAKHTFGTTSPL